MLVFQPLTISHLLTPASPLWPTISSQRRGYSSALLSSLIHLNISRRILEIYPYCYNSWMRASCINIGWRVGAKPKGFGWFSTQIRSTQGHSRGLSRVEEDMREYEAWIHIYMRACEYALSELRHSWEKFRRLPKKNAKGFKTLMRLAANAHTFDYGRVRCTTWSTERAGANLYGD